MACHSLCVRHKHNVGGWYEVQNLAGLTNCVRSQRLVTSKNEEGSVIGERLGRFGDAGRAPCSVSVSGWEL